MFILLKDSFSLISLQLYSSVDFGRKWQLIHEHVTPNRFYWWVTHSHISTFPPFYSAPFLFRKVLFAQECRKCCSCSGRLSKWYWWLRTSYVTDWWCCWNSAHFLSLDTIGQRLISFFRMRFAFGVRGHVAFHFISHTHTLFISGVPQDQIIIFAFAVEGRGVNLYRYIHADTWAMTNNGSRTFLSLPIQSCLLLTPPAVYLLCLKVHTHHKRRAEYIPAQCSLPHSDWGVPGIAFGYMHHNLHKSGAFFAIVA